MIEFPQVPNDRRGFVHKRLLGGVKSFVTSGFNPLSGIGGFLTPPSPPPVRRPPPRTAVARPSRFSAAEKEAGRVAKFRDLGVPTGRSIGGGLGEFIRERIRPRARGLGGCNPPLVIDVDGQCRFPSSPADISVGGAIQTGVGEAVMGRYGAGLRPGNMNIARAVCLRGMQLGNDGLCYNKGQIKNSERMWPRGRRPLLTGGDMRAISIAARAASRLTRTAVRLQEIGLIKKPVARKPRKKKG
ncbi:MAG: hypothetical protein V3T08_10165 [Gemmatimonadota bacterium]